MPKPVRTCHPARPLDVAILALPETAGSALYGMVDVLSATGQIWQTITGATPVPVPFRVRVVSPDGRPFECRNGIPVQPAAAARRTHPQIVIVPELWLDSDEHLAGRYPSLVQWLRARHAAGAFVYSSCSGTLLLAETGLLDGCDATSHWGYRDLFLRRYPRVRFRPETTLCHADATGRIVTAGGKTSWHDLALHIVSRHVNAREALRIAKAYLLRPHDEGQQPYESLVRHRPHDDALVRRCESWLRGNFRSAGVVSRAVAESGVPERTLKRRFKRATGLAVLDYVQNLRIEEAKTLLESTVSGVDEVGFAVGYEEPSFFRRLFKRRTGVSPASYRRLFAPIAHMPAVEDARPPTASRIHGRDWLGNRT